jgi:hypothetical protein
MRLDEAALLKEAKALAAQATPGPWTSVLGNGRWDTPTVETMHGGQLARATHYGKMREDAKLMAASVTMIPKLVAIIEDRDREIEILRLYGNKDCTARADEVLEKLKGPDG